MTVYKRYNGKRVKHGSKEYDKATWYIQKRIRGRLIHHALPEAKTKADAERIEAKIVGEAMRKRYGFESDISFSDFAEEVYWPYVEQHNEDVTGKRIFVDQLKKFFGKKPLRDITPQDCRDYQWQRSRTKTKTGGKRANASVNREMSTLRKMFNLACEGELIDKSPMQHGGWKLEEAPPRHRSLTMEQKRALFAELENWHPRYLNLAVLGLNLPLRVGQLLMIEPEDANFETMILWARRSKRRPPRPVPMNQTAAATIRAMIAAEQLPFPISYSYFGKKWREILIAAKINKKGGTREENFHFHDLRHLFGSELLRRGVSAYHIKELFGHSDIETSSIYITADHSQLADAVNRLDGIQDSEVVQ